MTSFLPDENLPANSFNARLDRFEAELNNVLSEKQKSLQKGGYGRGIGNQPKPSSPSTNLRERAISELKKRGKVVNEDTIKQAMELLGGQ